MYLLELSCPWIANREEKSEGKTTKYAPLRFKLRQQHPGYDIEQHNIMIAVLGDCLANVRNSMLGFHPRDETAMLVYKTIENGSTRFCITTESNSEKTFHSIVLHTNMAAMTSDENRQ